MPKGLAANAALVVVLHGCTQNAAGYDQGSGWSQLAERHGFALLYPEQNPANNANLCFNWFQREDTQRDRGEALSIRQMMDAIVDAHAIDRSRIFVTGLSAGGAMTAVMLATYPDLFAGGAIIAGLPYGSATTMPQAFDRMRGHGGPDAAGLGAAVRGASCHAGPWPTVSIWHGSGDPIVNPTNADAIVAQWRELHGLGATPSRDDIVDGYPRRRWCDTTGRAVIEEYSITGMGHGTPLATEGEGACGTRGAYMLEAGICSTRNIAAFWGLTEMPAGGAARQGKRGVEGGCAQAALTPAHTRADPSDGERKPPMPTAAGVSRVIDDALRAAGLVP
jgi:poly(hydroxyalkanoate) depolymerase family esterase